MGVLVLTNDNPSGLPENEKQYGVPVRFSANEPLSVKLFFGNNSLNNGAAKCGQVFPVKRLTVKTASIARASLDLLLSGVSATEGVDGYFSSINPGAKINSITVKNGTAKVDFDSSFASQLSNACQADRKSVV